MLAIYTVSRLRPAFGGMRAKQLRRLLRRQGVEVRDVGPGDSGWVTLAQLQEHCPDIARALGLLGRAEQLEAVRMATFFPLSTAAMTATRDLPPPVGMEMAVTGVVASRMAMTASCWKG